MSCVDLEHILDHSREIWSDLRSARLFVTGGTGFFGCWLLESFLWASDRLGLGATMTVLTRSPETVRAKAPHIAEHQAIRLVRGDVRSFAFPDGCYTHVIHGAAESSAKLNREQPLLVFDTMVEGTRRVLEFAGESGAGRFLLMSSGAVYGVQPPEIGLVPETWNGGPDPIDGRSAYGEGKRVTELLCTLSGLECAIARCFAFVGPYLPLDIHFAIGNFIRDCLEEKGIEIRGDGTPYRSYLYAADLAVWLWTILVRGKAGRPYNVGSERALSIAEVAATVAAVMGNSRPVRVLQARQPGKAPERYVPDTRRARTELGLEEWISLEESVRRTANWHCRNKQA